MLSSRGSDDTSAAATATTRTRTWRPTTITTITTPGGSSWSQRQRVLFVGLCGSSGHPPRRHSRPDTTRVRPATDNPPILAVLEVTLEVAHEVTFSSMHFFLPLSVPPHTPYSTRSLLLRLLRLSLPDGRHGSEGEPEISTTSPFVSGTRPPLPAWHTITVRLLPLVPGTDDKSSLSPQASTPVFSVSCKVAASRHWQ